MTVRERAEDIARDIDEMADEIAKRSIPLSSDDSFREWSSQRLHERIKAHASSIILDYLLEEPQTLVALGATRNDPLPPIAISYENAAVEIAFAA